MVGIGDCKVGRTPVVFVTHALGSCIGLCLFDAAAGVAGLLHILLPNSSINPEKAVKNPFFFADTGITHMLNEMERVGARRSAMVAKIAGGSSMPGGPKNFNVGHRNAEAVRLRLRALRIRLVGAHIGGSISRTVTLDEENTMIVRSPGRPEARY